MSELPGQKKPAWNESNEWDGFWEQRQRKGLGLFVSWFRHRFVTGALFRFILKNSQRGTLVEAGCGEGAVTLSIAKFRGDQAVLVDHSEQALALARKRALKQGVKASYIHCDIKELSQHVQHRDDNIIYNIGVIEHFKDCTNVLQEMAKASGLYAIALIPEKSIFWKTYIGLAFKLDLVPPDFYVYLFDESTLRDVVEKSGMKILWTRRMRVLGIIPYLGICFRFS